MKSSVLRYTGLSLIGSVLLAGAARADTVDYERLAIVISSVAAGPAEYLNADGFRARVLDVLKRATYDRNWTVGAYLAAHTSAQRKLERMGLESRRGGTTYLSDGAVEEDFEFPLTGPILNLILPTKGEARLLGRVACPTCGQQWPEGREAPRGVRLEPLGNGDGSAYTGILVDVRGFKYSPALFPRVVTEAGDEVYGAEFVDPKALTERGMVGIFHDRLRALGSDRVGPNPMTIRALRITGENGCDVVVSDYDAGRVHSSRVNLDLLAQCRVGFLLD